MISINVPKQDTQEKPAASSVSLKNQKRVAQENSEKKMTVEKYERMKKAGLVR